MRREASGSTWTPSVRITGSLILGEAIGMAVSSDVVTEMSLIRVVRPWFKIALVRLIKEKELEGASGSSLSSEFGIVILLISSGKSEVFT